MNLPENVFLLLKANYFLRNAKKNLLKETVSYLEPFIQKSKNTQDGSLTKGIYYKLRDYPFEGLVAGIMLASLHGYKLKPQERKAMAFCGAILALGDVFCDDTSITIEQMEQKLRFPEMEVPQNAMDVLFLEIYTELLKMLPMDIKEKYLQALFTGFEAEKNSRKLKGPKLPPEEVNRIIHEKGGVSLLIYRALIPIPLTRPEEKALFQCGAFTQVMDDLFDILWDLRSNTQTSALVTGSYSGIKKEVNRYYKDTVSAFLESGLKKKHIKLYLYIFNIFRLGSLAYINQMQAVCKDKLDPDEILGLDENLVKFKHFKISNILFIMPGTMTFKL